MKAEGSYMKRNPKKYLYDMLDACQFLLEVTAGKSIADYNADRVLRSAVERKLQIIGEALRQLANVAPELAQCIPEHDRIIRFRHVLVHGYDSIRPESVWDVIVHKLEPLHKELQRLLDGGK